MNKENETSSPVLKALAFMGSSLSASAVTECPATCSSCAESCPTSSYGVLKTRLLVQEGQFKQDGFDATLLFALVMVGVLGFALSLIKSLLNPLKPLLQQRVKREQAKEAKAVGEKEEQEPNPQAGAKKEDRAFIPYCKQHMTGKEAANVDKVMRGGLDSASTFTDYCADWIKHYLGATERVVIVPSGTAALEMAALLSNLDKGDEVIMPSFTFSSTANAFVLRGAVPVFIDVTQDTINMDASQIEAAISPKTRAICVVHYAGVACDMDEVMRVADKHNLVVIEDCAQAYLSHYKGRPLGTIGHFGCFSFHYTKNIICGEGGAICINRSDDRARRSLVLWEKGTNRYDFMMGRIDKYHWVDMGSSYVPNELSSAVLAAQLEMSVEITTARVSVYERYARSLRVLEEQGIATLPAIPKGCNTNAHIFFLIFNDVQTRKRFQGGLKTRGVGSVAHYVPLHSAPAGLKFGRSVGSMEVTDAIWSRLLRLPVWPDMTDEQVQHVIDSTLEVAAEGRPQASSF